MSPWFCLLIKFSGKDARRRRGLFHIGFEFADKARDREGLRFRKIKGIPSCFRIQQCLGHPIFRHMGSYDRERKIRLVHVGSHSTKKKVQDS